MARGGGGGREHRGRLLRHDARAHRRAGATTQGRRVMHIENVPFGVTDWAQVPRTEHAGETGVAWWRTREIGNIRVRMVEYSPGYLADHWCSRGHVLLVLEGELVTELQDGSSHVLARRRRATRWPTARRRTAREPRAAPGCSSWTERARSPRARHAYDPGGSIACTPYLCTSIPPWCAALASTSRPRAAARGRWRGRHHPRASRQRLHDDRQAEHDRVQHA